MNAKRLGKDQRKALEFVHKYAGWHTYDTDPNTRRIVISLEARGLVETNQYNQFRALKLSNCPPTIRTLQQ